MKFFNDDQFDERQQFERGKAFRNAYFSLILSLLVIYFVNSVMEKNIFDIHSVIVVPTWISLGVFCCTAIWKDAYESYKNSCGYFVPAIFGICGLLLLVISIKEAFDGDSYLNNMEFINSQLRSISQGIISLIIFAVSIAKQRIDKKSE